MQQLMPNQFLCFSGLVSGRDGLANLDYFQQLSPPVQLLLDFEK